MDKTFNVPVIGIRLSMKQILVSSVLVAALGGAVPQVKELLDKVSSFVSSKMGA